jgi:hypothetical protein
LINGTIQEGNGLKMLEKLEKSETDEGFKAMDDCRNFGSNFLGFNHNFHYVGHTTMKYIFADKTDDCQNAYQLYRCGKKRAPNTLKSMIDNEQKKSQKVKMEKIGVFADVSIFSIKRKWHRSKSSPKKLMNNHHRLLKTAK